MKSDRLIESIGTGPDSIDALLDTPSIGAYLKRQRELRGVSAEELARKTRIPLRSVERLESGSFDGEVDGFVRGFVRTVAIALGLDPHETIARMLAEPLPEPVVRHRNSVLLPRAMVGLAMLLLLALAIGLVRVMAGSGSPLVAGRSEDIVYRLDPVRALAESQAGAAVGSPGPAVSASPDRSGRTTR